MKFENKWIGPEWGNELFDWRENGGAHLAIRENLKFLKIEDVKSTWEYIHTQIGLKMST